MRLYSGEPIHSAFFIGHRECLNSLINYLPIVLKCSDSQILLQPEIEKIFFRQFKAKIHYEALTGSVEFINNKYSISIIQGPLDTSEKNRTFRDYCATTDKVRDFKTPLYNSTNFNELISHITTTTISEKKPNYFIYCNNTASLKSVQRNLRNQFGKFEITEIQKEYEVPQEEHVITLHQRIIKVASEFFIAYWLENERIDDPAFETEAQSFIQTTYRPTNKYNMSELKAFSEKYERDRLEQGGRLIRNELNNFQDVAFFLINEE